MEQTTNNGSSVFVTSTENSTKTVLTVLYSVIFVFSICGNGAMLTVLNKRFRLKSSNDLLLLNMVISESAVVGICIPFDLVSLKVDGEWVFGRTMCKIIWPLQTLPYGVMVWTLMFISLQRFRIVAFPMQKKPQPRSLIAIVVMTWVLSLISVLPYAMVLEMRDGSCMETWGIQSRRAYTVALFVTQYAIPLAVIAVCYTVIGVNMHKSNKKVQKHIAGRNKALLRRSRRQSMLIRMVALFVVVFAICMLPHHVVWLLNDFAVIENTNDHILTFAYLFTFTSTLTNPVIYFTHNSGFKKDLMSIICPCLPTYAPIRTGSPRAKNSLTYMSQSQFSTIV